MAEPYRMFRSKVVPLDAENVDTDQIVPARYLKVTDKNGLADALFRDWRFEEDGSLKEPRFILDQPGMAGRNILLVGDNFGAGSSREHAPWALTSWGIKAIFSTSFADIFRNNSLKNGLLPVVVDEATHAWLVANPGAEVEIDLPSTTLRLPDGRSVSFPVEAFARYCLMNGVDELGYLLKQADAIAAYERRAG
jgi:3-isopropylmalate/(R)-2-methylmalate dehydratase small subunit